jgi:hypothetical protein
MNAATREYIDTYLAPSKAATEKRILTWLSKHAGSGYWVRTHFMERSSGVLKQYGKEAVRAALESLSKAGKIEVDFDGRPKGVRLKTMTSKECGG